MTIHLSSLPILQSHKHAPHYCKQACKEAPQHDQGCFGIADVAQVTASFWKIVQLPYYMGITIKAGFRFCCVTSRLRLQWIASSSLECWRLWLEYIYTLLCIAIHMSLALGHLLNTNHTYSYSYSVSMVKGSGRTCTHVAWCCLEFVTCRWSDGLCSRVLMWRWLTYCV